MSWMAAFCAGVIILYCSGRLLPWHDYILCLLLILPLAHFARWRTSVMIVLGAGMGLSWASWHVQQQLDAALPLAMFEGPVQVEGYFCSLPQAGQFDARVDICPITLRDATGLPVASSSGRLRVYLSESLSPPHFRSPFRLELRLKPAVSRVNPRTQSAERSWFRQGVSALGNVKAMQPIPVFDRPFLVWLRQEVLTYRFHLRADFQQASANFEHAGLMQALLIGDRSMISAADNRLLTQTGTQHLMAISGLHVGLIMMLLHLVLPRTAVSLAVIALLSACYVVLVGAPASAQRAWLMAMCVLLAGRGYVPAQAGRAWLMAMTCVLLFDPAASLSAGFWYSFLAVGALLMMWRLKLMRRGWLTVFLVQALLFLFLHAFSVSQGLESHPTNIIANLIAIPWVSLVVLPLLLLTVFAGQLQAMIGEMGLLAINEVLHVLMAFFAAVTEVQWPVNSMGHHGFWMLFVGLWLACLILRGYRALDLVLAICLVLVILTPFQTSPSRDRIIVWDAGQGLALMLLAGEEVWLYDLGPGWPSGSLAEKELLPYLRKQGWLSRVQGLILSHGDSDHVGGAEVVVDALRPAFFWAGEPDRHAITRHATACRQGLIWRSAPWSIEVLYAEDRHTADSANNRSCVVLVRNGALSMLIMGDLEGEGERRFLRAVRGDINAQFLIAGHHGSRHATSYALLKRVRPDFVIFAAPAFGRFGHPHPDVQQRVAHMGAQGIHLGKQGAFTVYPPDEHHAVTTWTLEREQKTAFWLSRIDRSSGHLNLAQSPDDGGGFLQR